ncbi:MAG: gfo/Idh/MocA family oxidoreductase [Desulfobacteraceae bacterium]|nr:MAG: gfo/Idh/MocA family oxidoreductase [Desulfobacteraceae bacterium]
MERGTEEAAERRRVRLAVIGLGMIGKVHAQFASRLDECELAAVCDTDRSREKFSQELKTAFYTDYRVMLEREALDGVIVALPNEAHESAGSACVERGVHLFVEKPIAPTVEAAARLIERAAKNRVQLLVGHHRRFNPLVEAARQIIRGGELGSLLGVSVLCGFYKPAEYFIAGPWRKEKGGGPVLLNLIHEIDTLRYLCGEITRVYAEVSHKGRNFPVEDTVSVSLRFENDTVASMLLTDTAPSQWAYECTTGENLFFYQTKENCCHFFGTEASLDFPGLNKVYYADPNRRGWQHPLSIRKTGVSTANSYQRQLAHFCRVVSGEESPRTSGIDGQRTLIAIEAVLTSGQTRQPVLLEP